MAWLDQCPECLSANIERRGQRREVSPLHADTGRRRRKGHIVQDVAEWRCDDCGHIWTTHGPEETWDE